MVSKSIEVQWLLLFPTIFNWDGGYGTLCISIGKFNALELVLSVMFLVHRSTIS